MFEKVGQRKTIEGLVIPVAWDDEAGASAVSICGEDEEEYYVLPDARSHGLIGCLRALVRADVTLLGEVDGHLEVRVLRYEILRKAIP